MFLIDAPPTFQHKVIVPVPQADGSFAHQDFDAVFDILTQAELDQVITDIGPVGGPNDADANIIRRVLVSWKRIKNASDEEVPFSHEHREKLISIPYVRRAIAETFVSVLMGLKRKN